MNKKFYVTTPIYYPSGKPHIGSAYTTIAADILARWHKFLGEDVFFLTGTDEHTKKVVKAALKEGKTPKEYTDYITPIFKDAWKKLDIHYDRFIRTSDSDHKRFVQYVLSEVYKKGDIYQGFYEGLYCFECEAYYTEKDTPDKICPIHGKPLDNLKEETYFFRLSKYQKKLLEFYKKNREFISPQNRKNEILNRVKDGLRDLSISRKNEGWGVELPFDKTHVAFVWFDALTNYVSGIGILENKKLFKKFWPADVHLVGKDILWFHTVIWPAMLFAAGITPPKKVFAHGWWLADKQAKIGKSSGNAMDLDYLIKKFGVDSIRYFLFRSASFGDDAEFSETAMVDRHNNELANKLGNLVLRVSTLAEKFGLEKSKALDDKGLVKKVSTYFEKLEFDKALNEIFAFIDKLNEYVQEKKPWESEDKKVLWQVADGIKTAAILLSPFIPSTSEKIAKTFHFELNLEDLKSPLEIGKIKKAEVLFRKIETGESKNTNNMGLVPPKPASEPQHPPRNEDRISYESFSKMDLRVGKIVRVDDHPNADKLYVMVVDFGQGFERTIVAGLRKHYTKEQLVGRKAIFVVNLAPVKLRGIESDGMILAAVNGDESKVIFLTPEKDIEQGSKIR